MAYKVGDVFYLGLDATITAAGTGATTAQLDLSAYINPIPAKGRGSGLAIYKVHYDVSPSTTGGEGMKLAETGAFRGGLVAGAGLGNNATGVVTPTGVQQPSAENALAIFGFDYYGPKSTVANASTPGGMFRSTYLEPSKEVPYIVVRDNVCLVLEMIDLSPSVADMTVNMRLECEVVTLTSQFMTQLLRTQTV